MDNAQPSGGAVSPRATANLKRSMLLSIVVGAAALLLLTVIGHPLAGLFVVVGLAFGVLNTWLIQRSVVRYGENQRKGSFIRSVFVRLGIMTAAALTAAYFIRPDGVGLLAGIAIFQVIVMVGATLPVYKELRRS